MLCTLSVRANESWKLALGGSQRAVSLNRNLVKFTLIRFWGNGPLNRLPSRLRVVKLERLPSSPEGCPPPPTPVQKLTDVHTTGAEEKGISLICISERKLMKSKLEKRWEVPLGGEVVGYDKVLLIFDVLDAFPPRQYKLVFRDDPPLSLGFIP